MICLLDNPLKRDGVIEVPEDGSSFTISATPEGKEQNNVRTVAKFLSVGELYMRPCFVGSEDALEKQLNRLLTINERNGCRLMKPASKSCQPPKGGNPANWPRLADRRNHWVYKTICYLARTGKEITRDNTPKYFGNETLKEYLQRKEIRTFDDLFQHEGAVGSENTQDRMWIIRAYCFENSIHIDEDGHYEAAITRSLQD